MIRSAGISSSLEALFLSRARDNYRHTGWLALQKKLFKRDKWKVRNGLYSADQEEVPDWQTLDTHRFQEVLVAAAVSAEASCGSA